MGPTPPPHPDRPHDPPPGEVARWIDEARAGSNQALGQLMEVFRVYLTLIAREELGGDLRPKCGASDVVQDTFLHAQRGFGQFRGGGHDELKAWLRQILRNTLSNARRHYAGTGRRDVGLEQPLGGAEPARDGTPSALLMANEQADALNRALARLPDEYLRVIVMRQRDQESFERIGEATGRSAEAARKLWVRAVEKLRDELRVDDP